MKQQLSRIALAALLVSSVAPLAAFADAVTPVTAEERKIKINPKAPPEEIRRQLREAGVPEEQIEQIISQLPAAVAKAQEKAVSSASSSPAPSAPAASSEAPAAGKSAASSAPVAAKPAPINTAALDAQALENKDPALAADKKAVEALKREKSLMEAEIALADTKLRAELAPLAEARAKIEADRAIRQARIAAKNAEADLEKARIERRIANATAKVNESLNEKSLRIKALEAESRLIAAEAAAAVAAPAAEAALRAAREESERYATTAPVYLDEPLVNGTLHISDRRIPFNGPVLDDLADFVEKRIEFFNNKDPKKPIFIVIDSSPGGSALAGLRIVKAMQGSRAPVYVVVKQFAASMAAITATMADRCYVYPNTIILHHQASTGFQGTKTDLEQSMTFFHDLYERIFKPVYTKIGYKDSKSFETAMYKRFTSGDWAAFGDEAAAMKWVTGTVDRIEESGVMTQPTLGSNAYGLPFYAQGTVEKRDENGRAYFELPALTSQYDAWVLTDPEGRFKTR
jgi:ATP-dependent Clp protease protease subunit